MRAQAALVLLALAAMPAGADSRVPYLRPIARPPAATDATLATFRPMPRPSDAAPQTAPRQTALAQPAMSMLRPQPRPALPVQSFSTQTPSAQTVPDLTPVAMASGTSRKSAKVSMQGAVCNRADIKGKVLQPIVSRVKGCNVPDAVQVSEIAGVALSPPATIDCEEATALSDWITHGLQPAFNHTVARLEVADSYACRPRNNVPGNPVSVHGQGQAIDIAAFVTTSGRTLSVAQDYNAAMRQAQKAGCGTFRTILGPGSDGYHETHIHFDVAPHGGRDYCH